MMKTTVVYHSADYDGIFCREIARKFLPDAELIGWNFGDKPINPLLLGDRLFVLDLPVDRIFGFNFNDLVPDDKCRGTRIGNCSDVIWIDHHKSSIESHPTDIPGYRIDGVAACRLSWQWFTNEFGPSNPYCHPVNYNLPQKEHFVDRKVTEPLAVRLAGEYDIWDKRDSRCETFQYGLRTVDEGADFWEALLDNGQVGDKAVREMLENGWIAQRYTQKVDADLVTHRSYLMEWEGLNWLVLNTGRFNSLTFAALDKSETGHDALLGYMFNGKCWMVSMYHAKHRTDLDLSKIAVKHGGGGHRGACGFTCQKLPF